MALSSDRSTFFNDRVSKETVSLRPIISGRPEDQLALKAVCPTNAIGVNPTRIDLGKCVFCMACADVFKEKISFTPDVNLATNVRDRLVMIESFDGAITLDRNIIRQEILEFRGDAIRLKLLSSQSAIMTNDKRVTFVGAAEEAHAIVVNSADDVYNLSRAEYDKLRDPKAVIIAGQQAITAMDHLVSIGAWYHHFKVDLYVPGDPVHPTTLVNGILNLFNKNI